MIEQRLQDKLKKETDSVRRAEEAKKEKQTANRKEEELQLKDSIVCTSLPTSNAIILTGGGRFSISCEGRGFRCFPTSFSPQMSSPQTARPHPPSLPTHQHLPRGLVSLLCTTCLLSSPLPRKRSSLIGKRGYVTSPRLFEVSDIDIGAIGQGCR